MQWISQAVTDYTSDIRYDCNYQEGGNKFRFTFCEDIEFPLHDAHDCNKMMRNTLIGSNMYIYLTFPYETHQRKRRQATLASTQIDQLAAF